MRLHDKWELDQREKKVFRIGLTVYWDKKWWKKKIKTIKKILRG
jgi:hypothetical protein